MLERFRNCYWKLDGLLRDREGGGLDESGEDGALDEAVAAAGENFQAEMEDDANTAGALAAVFDLVRAVNEYGERAQAAGRVSAAVLEKARGTLDRLLYLLGIEITPEDYGEAGLEQELLELVELREQARSRGDYAAADAARDRILAAGYEIRDTPQGPRLVRKG
jgi:cysteinyl-tRNA synthetase